MKTQTQLSELDATKLANIQLRQALLTNELQAFGAQVFAEYGNPGEHLAFGADGSIVRTPAPPPTKATRPRRAR